MDRAFDNCTRPRGVYDAIELVGDAVVVIDDNLRVVTANRWAEQFFGTRREDWVGRVPLEWIHPDDVPIVLSSHTEVMQRELGTPIEVRLRAADGRYRLMEIVGATHHIGDTTVVVLSLRDLTERRRWEVAAGRPERFRSLVEDAPVVLALVEADGRVNSVSGAFNRQLGHDLMRVIGHELAEFVAQDERDAFRSDLVAATAGPGTSLFDTTLVHLDGRCIPYQVAVVNRLDDPVLQALAVSLFDITERRRHEAALRDSETRTRSILDTAADAIITVDDTGRIEGFNRAAERIFGASAEQAVGCSYAQFLPEPSADRLRYDVRRGTDFSRPAEVVARRVSGDEFPSHVSISSAVVDGRDLYTAIVRDITEQKAIERQLENMALHDELTGLPNRRLLVDRLDEAIARARRHEHLVGVMFLDLDRFKLVNDSLGHDIGDELLVLVAQRIRHVIREVDTLARLGGDEFVVLCEEPAGVDVLSDLAVRIAEALRGPFPIADDEVFVTVSIGISVWDGGNETALELLRYADTAMYRAKERGRARFELFDEHMQAWVTARLEFESALRRAIDRHELRAYYQPVVELDGGRPTHFEALVRWQRPNVGLVDPHEFVEVAEDTGLIVPIGDWMLRRATGDCASWQHVAPGVGVSVNVSARQFNGDDLATAVDAALAHSGLAPELLTLEITESVLLDDTERHLTLLQELRARGVRIALDDFGTGFSSLTYLRRLPIDQLKIDQSFLCTLDDTTEDTVMLRAIINLGQAYNLTVIAEGIDSPNKLHILRQLGCRHGQGFLFAPAAPIRDALAHLTTADPRAHASLAQRAERPLVPQKLR